MNPFSTKFNSVRALLCNTIHKMVCKTLRNCSAHSPCTEPRSISNSYFWTSHFSTSPAIFQRTIPIIPKGLVFKKQNTTSIDKIVLSGSSAYVILLPSRQRKCDRRPRRLKKIVTSRLHGMKEDVWTIPNLLTVSRMLCAPVLSYLVIHAHYHSAVALFALAGATDMLDGYIARRFTSQMSVLGTALDPLADKLLIALLTVSLTVAHLLPVWLTVLIVSRDVALVAASAYTRYHALPPPKSLGQFLDVTLPTATIYPSNISKLNTLLQLSSVGFTLAAPVFGYIDHPYLHFLWYMTACTTIASGLGYWRQAKKSFSIIKQS